MGWTPPKEHTKMAVPIEIYDTSLRHMHIVKKNIAFGLNLRHTNNIKYNLKTMKLGVWVGLHQPWRVYDLKLVSNEPARVDISPTEV